jgi:hypothetical protein
MAPRWRLSQWRRACRREMARKSLAVGGADRCCLRLGAPVAQCGRKLIITGQRLELGVNLRLGYAGPRDPVRI